MTEEKTLTEEEKKTLNEQLNEINDVATMISEITLTFHAVSVNTPEGKERGVIVTHDMMLKMIKGALNALDPEKDLDDNNIYEIAGGRFSFKCVQTGRALKQQARKKLAEAEKAKPKPKPKSGTGKKPAMKSAKKAPTKKEPAKPAKKTTKAKTKRK